MDFAFSFLLSRSGIVFTFVVFLFFLVKHMNSSCLCDSSFFFSKLGIACLFSFCISFSHSFSSGSTFQLLEFIWHLHSFPILISYGFSLSISFTNSWWDFPFLFFLSFDIHRTCVSFKGLDISRWGFNLQDKMVPTLRMTCQVLFLGFLINNQFIGLLSFICIKRLEENTEEEIVSDRW